MGSRGGGFLSLVVANGAIYNRIIIPGKTRLLTPCRGDLAQPPLPFPAEERPNGAELEGGSLPKCCPLRGQQRLLKALTDLLLPPPGL